MLQQTEDWVFSKRRELLRYATASEVGEALHRLAEGNYGVCVNCGTQISDARLRVKPEAIRCIACQMEYERLSAA